MSSNTTNYQLLVDHGIKSVYLSNKMRHLPNFGRDWFDTTRPALQALGIKVYCPVELDRIFPCPIKDHGSQEAWRHFMQRDLEVILQMKPDAILLGPQWVWSPGANIEAAVAAMVVGSRCYLHEAGGAIYQIHITDPKVRFGLTLWDARSNSNG